MAGKKKYLSDDGLRYYDTLVKGELAKKASGADLDALEAKVDEMVAEGGEPNVIESITVNGTPVPVTGKAAAITTPTTVAELTDAVDYAKKADVPTTVAELTDAGDYALKTDVQSAVHYKGTVATYSALPSTGLVVGDLYNVEQADAAHGVRAGDNVVWNGSAWDVQAGTVDLSGYVQASDLVEITNAEIDAIVAGE